MPSTRWTVRTLCALRDAFLPPVSPPPPPLFPLLPFFFLFLFHPLPLSLFLSLPPFVSPLLHFLLSIPSRALLRSRILFYLLFSPRLIFAKASSRLADVRGPKFRSPPPWVSIFKGSHLFSSFCLLFLRFLLRRPVLPAPLRYLSYPSSNTPFTPTIVISRTQILFSLQRDGAQTGSTYSLFILLVFFCFFFFFVVIFYSLIPGASSIVYFSCHLSLTSRWPQASLSYPA